MKEGAGRPTATSPGAPGGDQSPDDPEGTQAAARTPAALRWIPKRVRPKQLPRRVTVLWTLVVIAMVAGIVIANVRIRTAPVVSPNQLRTSVAQGVKSSVQQVEEQAPPAMTVYDKARAGLVIVQAVDTGGGSGSADESLGAGIVVDQQGDILTALHVVNGMVQIKVTFSDGTTSLATIKSRDPSHDIAVLEAERLPAVLTPEVLGGGPAVGQPAYAIGNPLGLVTSLSSGVISGVNRSFRVRGGQTLSGMIQFDAAVNPGSSGGPLLNAQGQVIGIVEGLANAANTEVFSGIGFAVPISQAGQAAGAPPK